MKAIIVPGFGEAPQLRDDVPVPAPGDREALVRVQASSINPVDNAIAAGMLDGMFEHEFPVILGRDYAGVVEQVGSGVTGLAPGHPVFGFVLHANPTVRDGSWAELIKVGDNAARVPEGVDVAAAGAAPLAGITAVAAIDALQVTSGDRVLIVGATGGVGGFAVQLAARAGATVIAPALPEDEEYLRRLGVTELVERDGDLSGLDPVDALIDLVSYTPDALNANAAALKPGGRAASPIGAAGDGPGRANVMAVPSPENLTRLAGLLADGTLRVPVQRTYDLAQAGEGLQALATTHTQGKLALSI
jgi:NADPH:quinone reductase-like Zn-dependent oxidoreductase